MGKFDPTKEITNHDAALIIRDILEFGNVIITPHAREEMIEGNFTDADIVNILECGEIKTKQYDTIKKNWKYRFVGNDIDGDEGVVITAIVRRSSIVIVTTW
jgi:hypothetical protein